MRWGDTDRTRRWRLGSDPGWKKPLEQKTSLELALSAPTLGYPPHTGLFLGY